MAKIVLLCFAVILTFATFASGLKCLKCNDCENEPTATSSCLPGFSVCMKTRLSGKIRKGCAPSIACKLEDVDRGSLNPLKNLKTIFSDHDMKKLISDKVHAKDKMIYCCEGDFCNGSSERGASLGLLVALSLALYIYGW